MSTATAPSPLTESTFPPSSPSPFAMGEDHEFPDSPSRKIADLMTEITAVVKEALVPASPLPPALPGTAASPYRRCPCVGSLPGRVCSFCSGTKWTRLCPRCEGEGRIDLNVRKGAERSVPCGFCGTRGTLPASLAEIAEAIKAVEEFAASPDGQAIIVDDQEPEFRRAVRLPGIGVTATKRVGTLSARECERQRLAKRTAKRKREKAAAAKVA